VPPTKEPLITCSNNQAKLRFCLPFTICKSDQTLPLVTIGPLTTLIQTKNNLISMSNRAPGRNIHIYSGSNQDMVLGGLVLNKGMTNYNFYSMVEICFIFENDYTLLYENEVAVPRDDAPLQAGKYFIITSGSLTVNPEPWLVRTNLVFPSCGTRTAAFHDAVRERDGRCVITGDLAIDGVNGYWHGFEASHVFPLAYEEHWNNHNYGDWVTIPCESGGSINSVQNGILLRTDIQCLFDTYSISINPDVCMVKIFSSVLPANDSLRTITRSSASGLMVSAFPVTILIRSSSRIPADLPIKSYVGTLDRQCLRMSGGRVSHFSSAISHLVRTL